MQAPTTGVSDYYEKRRRMLIAKVIAADPDNPITEICIDRDTLKLIDQDVRRVGRPRNN